MNLLKFLTINKGLSAAKRDWKIAFGSEYSSALMEGEEVQFEIDGYVTHVMDWEHERYLSDVFLEEMCIIKKSFLAHPERIVNLSDMQKLRIPLQAVAEYVSHQLGISRRHIKTPSQNASIIQLTTIPCVVFFSVASTKEMIIEQIASVSNSTNNYHVIFTLFDFRSEQLIQQKLENHLEVRWLGEALDFQKEEVENLIPNFADEYESYANTSDKILSVLPAPKGCGWANLKLTLETACNSIIQYDEYIVKDELKLEFEDAKGDIIDGAKIVVPALKISGFFDDKNHPNKEWLLLREYAFCEGFITDSKICPKRNHLSTCKGVLAEILAELVNLPSKGKGGPFPSTTSKGSKCKFKIGIGDVSVKTNEYNSRPYNPNIE